MRVSSDARKTQLADGATCTTTNYITCGYSRTCVVDKCGAGLAGGAACAENHECASWIRVIARQMISK